MTTVTTALAQSYPGYYAGDTDPNILAGIIGPDQVLYVMDGTLLKANGMVTVTDLLTGQAAEFFYQSKTVITGTVTRLGLVTLLGQYDQSAWTAFLLSTVTQDQPVTYWEEMLDPSATVQDTETRVFVGAPLAIVQNVLQLQGDATPTNAATTLAVDYPTVHPSDTSYGTDYFNGLVDVRDVVYVTDGSLLTSQGVVLVNDAVWFSYTSKTVITGTVTRLNGATVLNQRNAAQLLSIAGGSAVTQWWDITSDGMTGTLTGQVNADDFGWNLQLEGIRWNSQLEFQDASILVQQRQYNGVSGAWTSWRDKFLGYLDTPEITATPDGNKVWRVTARGRMKYLNVQQVAAGVYGAAPVTCTYSASSSLEQAQAETRFIGTNHQPDAAGDGKLDTAWVSKGIPGVKLLAPHPGLIGYDTGLGRWVPPQNQVQQFLGGSNVRIWPAKGWALKLQQVYCSGIEGDRLTQQMQTWFEIYNINLYDTDPSEGKIAWTSLILENNYGQRLYLGTQNGGKSEPQYLNAQESIIFCYDEKTFREQWPVADGVTVKQYKLCDGWFGAGTPTREYQRGAGAVFRLDPRGGWLGLRLASSGNFGVIADPSEAFETPPSTFVEPWLDFVCWGDLGEPYHALPEFWDRLAAGLISEPENPGQIIRQGFDGTTQDRRDNWPFVWEPWRAPYTPVAPNGIPLLQSIRRTAKDSASGGDGANGGVAAYAAMGGGAYAVDIDSDGTFDFRNFDSNTADDWTVGAPVVGNRDALLTAEWIQAEQQPFAAAVVVNHDTIEGTIEVDDATNYDKGAVGTRPALLSDQTMPDGRRIAFWYGYRDATHFYQVEFPAAYAGTELAPGTTLTAYADVTNGGSSRAVWEAVNIRRIAGVRWAVYSANGNTPYPTKYRIRVTGWADPADHSTYLGNSFQWLEVVHVEGNTATQGYHPITGKNGAPLWVRKLVFEIDEMSDGGRAALSELQLMPVIDNSDELVGDTGGAIIAQRVTAQNLTADRIQEWLISSVADKLLAKSGVPKNLRLCVGGPAISSVRISTGSYGDALRSLAKRGGCLWGESRMGMQLFGPDPRTPYGQGRITPVIVIDASVARDQLRMREAAHFQIGQVQLTARDDVAGLDYVVNYPPAPFRLGNPVAVTDRYVSSAAEAVTCAQTILNRGNRGHTVEVNVGGWNDFELLDVARINGLSIDESGVYINNRDYWIQGATCQFGAQGMQVTLTLEERSAE